MQPFRFHSIYQPRIWGGQSMRTMLGRELPDRETAYGEAWEISDRPEAMSIVKDGEWEGMPLHRLWEEHRQEIFGPGYERFPRFPLLCKILDARENLSVQVHPPERTAAARQGEVKNEIWYVLHASPDALIYGGMKENATLPDIRHAAETGQMEQLIRSTHLEPGEHLYIPAGLVHAIGAGHLIAESSRIAIPPTAFMTGTARMTPDEDGNCTWNRHWIPSGNSGNSASAPDT